MAKSSGGKELTDKELPSRINAVLEHLQKEAKRTGDKYTKERFAEEWGVGSRSIYNWIDGSQEPDMGNIMKFAKAFPFINIEWLLTGAGPMLKAQATESAIEYSFAGEPEMAYDDQAGRLALTFFRTFDALLTQRNDLLSHLKSRQ